MSQIRSCAFAKMYLQLMSLHSWGFKGPTKRSHLPLFSVTEVLRLTKMFYRNNSVAGKEPGAFPLGWWWGAQREKAPELIIAFTISDNFYFPLSVATIPNLFCCHWGICNYV